MIPIKKNIHVVDEFGNRYEDTYLKRANGLAKKGRAHFIDDMTISLMCPPINTEDNKMENKEITIDQAYVISKIDQILNDKDYLTKALDSIAAIPESKGPGDLGASSKAQAIAEIVKDREVTNQRMIGLLNDIYISLKNS